MYIKFKDQVSHFLINYKHDVPFYCLMGLHSFVEAFSTEFFCYFSELLTAELQIWTMVLSSRLKGFKGGRWKAWKDCLKSLAEESEARESSFNQVGRFERLTAVDEEFGRFVILLSQYLSHARDAICAAM